MTLAGVDGSQGTSRPLLGEWCGRVLCGSPLVASRPEDLQAAMPGPFCQLKRGCLNLGNWPP